MTPADDLNPGDWVALVSCRAEPEPSFFDWRPRPVAFDGRPLRVLAVSLPFVAVESAGRRFGIDLRAFDVRRVTARYARALMESAQAPGPAAACRRRRKAKPDPRCCVRCGCRYVQRLAGRDRPGVWHRVCPDCGFDAGAVPA